VKLEKIAIPDAAIAYKPSAPFTATVLDSVELTEQGSPDEVRNIVLDISGSGVRYLEGQSVGIIPPGTQPDGKPHKPRLYSVASPRTGDDGTSQTVTICVKRVMATDEATGTPLPGIASNYLCDLRSGDRVTLIGPSGRRFLLPADDRVNLILVAVGTGIAPFRAFIHHIYREKGSWRGKIRLYYGAKQAMDALFMNRRNEDIGHYMSEQTFTAFRALSRVDDGHQEKGYVQQRLAQNIEETWEMLLDGNFALYICGLKGMEKGVDTVFAEMAAKAGRDWAAMKAEFVANGQWLTEVY
jgi:ferredoxin--NADP+ reductase